MSLLVLIGAEATCSQSRCSTRLSCAPTLRAVSLHFAMAAVCVAERRAAKFLPREVSRRGSERYRPQRPDCPRAREWRLRHQGGPSTEPRRELQFEESHKLQG